ncbi:MAG: hypothetical protein AAB677_03350 [Patescibacteria group bacterium]
MRTKRWICCSLAFLAVLTVAGLVLAELSERAIVAMVAAGGG